MKIDDSERQAQIADLDSMIEATRRFTSMAVVRKFYLQVVGLRGWIGSLPEGSKPVRDEAGELLYWADPDGEPIEPPEGLS